MDKRFLLKILVAADIKNKSWEHDQRLALEKFKNYQCEVFNAFDSNGNLQTLPKDLVPDIVFFPKVIEGDDPFSITKFPNSLNCYVPYSTYGDNNPTLQYNRIFHNLLWRHYVATDIHFEISKEVNYIKSKNIRVSGYPGFDNYLFSNGNKLNQVSLWPNDTRKKIIWAPHHTIESSENNSNHSNFLLYHEFFKEIALQFRDEVCFAFKPHPNLRLKLYGLDRWGEEITKDYYNWWDQNENTLLVESDYEDLFINSDALIHDSVSFMAEYLCLGKPSCYLVKDESKLNKFLNKFGLSLLDYHKKAYSNSDITAFIRTVLASISEKNYDRGIPSFLQANEIRSSEFIYNDIKDSLFT
jgi:hypothetical protein